MRWVFLLLLLLNVGLFVWQHRLAPSAGGELSLSMRTPTAAVAPAQSLRLLAEAQQAAATAGMAGTGGSSEESVARCLVLGGFNSMERARQLKQRLLSLDIAVRVVSAEASFGSDHWVYIPPLASRQASLRQLRELQARGVDSYLITEGEMANGILLGVFPRLDAAVSVADKLRASGYAPQLRELPRIYQEYWVRVAEKDQRLVDGAVVQRLQADFSDLKHQLISCSGVAHR